MQAAIVEMKRKTPRFGCRRIAQQIAFIFGVEISKDIVRRVLAKHDRPVPGSGGPSWLTSPGHTKDSLWSAGMFRCEWLIPRSHWVMVVMDQYTRRTIGFAVRAGALDRLAVCRMFNRITAGHPEPLYLSSDSDPLFRYPQRNANLGILDIEEIKTVRRAPLSHPFVERWVGSVLRESLDQAPFWHACDLERKLGAFAEYYNESRVHHALSEVTPDSQADGLDCTVTRLDDCRWQSHCRGLYQLPVAA